MVDTHPSTPAGIDSISVSIELNGEEIADLFSENSDRVLLEDFNQFQIDGETVLSIWAKHQDIVDMRFWTLEAVPVVHKIAAFLGLDNQ